MVKLAIDRIEKKEKQAIVYNLEVQDFNSYFVFNLGIWVHNCQVGTYTITFESCTFYHGKGPIVRMKRSAREQSLANGDPVASKSWTPAKNHSEAEAFKEEARRIQADGGTLKGNYNKINSPGKKMLEAEEQRRRSNGG